jgi:hypothetical protein
MARFRLASRASFRSPQLCVSARFSIRLDVWVPEIEEIEWLDREIEQHDRMLRELDHYTTHAEVRELEAVLDRYPDDDTEEIRAVLADRR